MDGDEMTSDNSNRRASLISGSPPPSTLRPARVLLVFAVVIPCAAGVVNGLPICRPPLPFTNIWQCQVCWEDMPWTWDTGMEESGLSTATPDESLSTSSVAFTTGNPQPTLSNSELDAEDTPLSTSSAATATNQPKPTNTEGVEVVKTDMNLTGEELHALQTVSSDDTVWQMVGVTGVGKSLLGNFLREKDEFKVKRPGVAGSVTDTVQVGCSVLNSQRLCIVDTPGCFDTRRGRMQNEEAENLANDVTHLAVDLSKTILMARHGIHAFLVVVRADVTELVSTTVLLDLFGIIGNFWNHTIVVFTHGKRFDETSEDKKHTALEATLNSPNNCPEDWKTLIEKAGNRYVIVESKEWRDDKEYHKRKVKEFIKHSSAIVSSHGPYNDTLLSLVRVHIENAKLELRYDFSNVDSPEAQVAALQIAFPNIKRSLHKIISMKLAGGVDVEAKEEELLEAHRRNDQLHQQVQKEQAEKRKAQEAEDRAREEQRVAEEQARVDREAAEKARRELEEYLKKPTFAERIVETRITREGFYKWEYVYTAEAVDVATEITAKARNYQSKGGAKEHARINLKAILLERGIIRKD